MSPRYLAFISPTSPLYLAYISPLSAQVKKEVDMGVTVEAATTIAQVVTSAVVTTVAAGVGSTVAASVAGAGAGGAIMLLGQVGRRVVVVTAARPGRSQS